MNSKRYIKLPIVFQILFLFNCFANIQYQHETDYKRIKSEEIALHNFYHYEYTGDRGPKSNIMIKSIPANPEIKIKLDPSSKLAVGYDFGTKPGRFPPTFILSVITLYIFPIIMEEKYSANAYIWYEGTQIKIFSRNGNAPFALSPTLTVLLSPLQILWYAFGDPMDEKTKKLIQDDLIREAYKELLVISKMSEDEIKIKYLDPLQKKASPSDQTIPGYSDSVILKSGQTISGVKTKIAGDSIIVDYPNGESKVYKKTQVQSVERK